ncbi:MAG: RNA-binding S4 domain-containing protein, partial [Saprospiraceae bacterium]
MNTAKVRVDKWLWSVRIFKSRTIATDACKGGKVKLNGANLKPSAMVQQGDVLTIRKNGFDFQFKVLELIEKRVSAPIAQKCYENITPQEELNKYQEWFIAGKAAAEKRDRGTG